MKKIFILFTLFCSISYIFAGDAAAFVDIGISNDGKTYVFAEYGKTDKTFRGYAEIYTVDIEKNDFVKGGLFRTLPSESTSSKSGLDVYNSLYSKAKWWLKKYNCTPVSNEHILYIADSKMSGDSEIVFKDIEGSTMERSIYYHIKLEKTIEPTAVKVGDFPNIQSSFYINLEKSDENGHVISKNIVGSPEIKRKGIVDYKIEKIYSDYSNRSLVFVIEKTEEDSTGTSIRYMVETIRL